MGVSGCMLGEKRTKWLSRKTGLSIERAFRFGNCYEAIVRDAECKHYIVDSKTFVAWENTTTNHIYASCGEFFRNRDA